MIPDLHTHTNIQDHSPRRTNLDKAQGSFQLLGSEVFSSHSFGELIPDLPTRANIRDNSPRRTNLTKTNGSFQPLEEVFSDHCLEAHIHSEKNRTSNEKQAGRGLTCFNQSRPTPFYSYFFQTRVGFQAPTLQEGAWYSCKHRKPL